MPPDRPAPAQPLPSFEHHAEEQLRFIRQTMERSGSFTAVPGVGGAVMGGIGLAAALVAAQQPTAGRWLAVWLIAAAIGCATGVFFIRRKARRLGATLGGGPARRFATSLAAPLVAGASLTWALWMQGLWTLMPPVWLLLYGTGVLTGGAFSVAAIRLVGALFMALGIAALLTPPAWGDAWLALGFGGLQLGFGAYIAKRHGG